MAYKVAIANGNWSTAATWDNVSNTPTMHATTNVTLTAAADTDYTPQFTAPVVDATCAATGVALFFATISTVGTVTVTLQQNPAAWADVATCTGSINCATIYAALGNSTTVNNWIYFRAATPHVFTVADANYYRWKIVLSGATGNSTVAADATSTTLASFWSTNVIAVLAIPAATDLVMIPGQGDSTVIKVSVDGSRSIGNLTNTAACIAMRPATASLFWDVQIGYGGELNFDNTASATLTCKGSIAVGAGGTFRMDNKAGAAYAAAFVAKVIFDPTTSGDCGIGIFDKSTVVLQGKAKSSTTLYKTHPAANWIIGEGVLANPVETSTAVDWEVEDHILIGATGAYDQTEYRYINAKTDASTYTFSSTTPGGADAGLTYAHSTNAWVLNLTRNVVIETDDAAKGCYLYNANTLTSGGTSIKWVRFNNAGSSTANKYGIAIESSALVYADFDYNVIYNSLYYGLSISSGAVVKTYTGNIVTQYTTGNLYQLVLGTSKNKTFIDTFLINGYRSALYAYSSSTNLIFTNLYVIAGNQSNSGVTSGYHAIYIINSFGITINNLECHLNRQYGMLLGTSADVTFGSPLLGSKGANVAGDIYIVSDSYLTNVVFNTPTITDLTFVRNNNAMIVGSEVKLHKLNGVENKHYAYRATGVYQATGVGLVDTTVRTVGSYAVGMFPDATTGGSGLKWTSYVMARAGNTCVVYGYHNRTTADLTVNLYLPGSTTADDTFTDTTTSGWQSWLVSAAYAGTVDGLAKVEIIATGTAGSIYVDDWYNGTNPLTALDVWEGGRPALIIYPELGDPAAIWADIIAAGKSAGQLLELIAAMCRLAKNTGFAAGPCVVRNLADTADLATITFDANGNVTNVVLA